MDNLSKNIKAYNKLLEQNIISEDCKKILSIIDSKNKQDEALSWHQIEKETMGKITSFALNSVENNISKGMDI